MKTHIRIDAFKVFEEDEERIARLGKEEKIKGKSDIYREALKFWDKNREMHKVIQQLTAQISDMTVKHSEKMDDLYFKLDTITKRQ